MRYEAHSEPLNPNPRPHRRFVLLGMLGIIATIPSGKELPPRPTPHIPELYLENLRQRLPGADLGSQYQFSAGNYLARENENGGNITEAIMELAGINPDVAYSQIDMLLAKSYAGRALSRQERQAIVMLTNQWPDRYEPVYTVESALNARRTATTRQELVNRLRYSYPALRRSFERWERPQNTDEVASRER